ncbi:lasso peptide biosynthesis B2 protein [Actinoallomurus sp. NPDC050550]|uniref:lasso peptide biosynthesis B2 protein n=1 Tax=Actinoallomurus sp. NPDC050550 TaxID=3154937 RepID=UPI0033E4451E
MSAPVTVTGGGRLPLFLRSLTFLVVGAARVLARLPPRRIRVILVLLRAGARPADYDRARRARHAVVTTSVLCAGEGCLQRSLATALLCRAYGVWPTWHVGVRTEPFMAHAWVEAEGRPVDEPDPPGYYHSILSVPPRTPQA